jgi:hypothetical protein
MAKYRKKPVVIEAIQWDGTIDTLGQIELFMHEGPSADYTKGNKNPTIIIPTLEGDMIANVGDWIIKGVKGEFYPCKPDIFEKTYEKVE